MDKTVKQVYIHYQNYGEVEFYVKLTNHVTGDTQTQLVTAGTVSADLKRRLVTVEFVLEGEDIELEIVRLSATGPLFIEDIIFKFMPWEEQLGTAANPSTVTSAYNVDPTEVPFLLVAMDGPVTVGYLDPDDLECEVEAIVSNTLLLPFQTEQGSIPGFTYEKQVCRVMFHYQYLGPAVVRVRLTSMRGQVSLQDVTLTAPTGGMLTEVQMAVADIFVVDEINQIEFIPQSGPVMIIDYTAKYEQKGERGK